MSHHTPLKDKLVRDKIPSIRSKAGWTVTTRRLQPGHETKVYLEIKLREELEEFHRAKTRNEEIEEIADVIEVLEAIRYNQAKICPSLLKVAEDIEKRHLRYFSGIIQTRRIKKLQEKGVFSQLAVIVFETRRAE